MSWETEEWRKARNHDPEMKAPFKRESLNRRRKFQREARNAGRSLATPWAVPAFGIMDGHGTIHYTVKAI